jgi:hypothetical protein
MSGPVRVDFDLSRCYKARGGTSLAAAPRLSMNPLKNLFNKVFTEAAPPNPAGPGKEDAAFEWNPDQETVAPTTARSSSWKREEVPEAATIRAAREAASADNPASVPPLPTPTFERTTPKIAMPDETLVSPPPSTPPSLTSENWVKPSIPEPSAASLAPAAPSALTPLSDFEDVYRKAGIKSPIHGYGVERVYRLLTSRRLVGLDRNVRRSALLTALDAAGVPASDVSQDAVLRRKALTAFEAEKALELQSLRSRNESRAEALQDTIETFTRQKQSQIERLAQGSTSAVRAQSDLEIRKRMEQDRLYRCLAYFVEPLPSAQAASRSALPEKPKAVEAVTIEATAVPVEAATPETNKTESPS